MFESIEQYIIYRLVESIIFGTKNYYNDVTNIFSINILTALKDVVEVHIEENHLNIEEKDNLYNFLNCAREVKDEDYKERIEIINDIIIMLNNQKNTFSTVFYRKELFFRTDNKWYITKAFDHEILNYLDNMRDSIIFDTLVLEAYYDDVTDEEFFNEYLSDLTENLYFYESLNSIIREYPKIFENTTFYNRIMYVLNKNSEISKSKQIDKEHKKLVKRICNNKKK